MSKKAFEKIAAGLREAIDMTAPTPHAVLVDAVARAILNAAREMKQSLPTWEDADKFVHPSCGLTIREAARVEARAAIAAVREALRDLDARMVKADPYGMGYGRLNAVWSGLLAASPLAEDGDDGR